MSYIAYFTFVSLLICACLAQSNDKFSSTVNLSRTLPRYFSNADAEDLLKGIIIKPERLKTENYGFETTRSSEQLILAKIPFSLNRYISRMDLCCWSFNQDVECLENSANKLEYDPKSDSYNFVCSDTYLFDKYNFCQISLF